MHACMREGRTVRAGDQEGKEREGGKERYRSSCCWRDK